MMDSKINYKHATDECGSDTKYINFPGITIMNIVKLY